MKQIIFLIWLIAWATAGILLLLETTYFVYRDTTAWLKRAQVAAEARDMSGYLDQSLDGMKKWNLESGHAAFVFKTPYNEMSLIVKSLTRAANRADELRKLEKNSTEYQVGLDDLRGILRELDLQAEYRYCIGHPIWFWFSALFWIGPCIYGLYKLLFEW